MTWFRLREADSPGRSRVFIYLALSVVFLLLSYQLVLNHESISRWEGQQGLTLSDEDNGNANADVRVDYSNLVTISEDGPGEPVTPNEREIVLAAMRSTDLSWVEDNLHEWRVNVYRADMSSGQGRLTVPMNKGNEAMVYLTCVWTMRLLDDPSIDLV